MLHDNANKINMKTKRIQHVICECVFLWMSASTILTVGCV